MNFQNRDPVIELMVVNYIGIEITVIANSITFQHRLLYYHSHMRRRYFQECVNLTNVIPYYVSKQ